MNQQGSTFLDPTPLIPFEPKGEHEMRRKSRQRERFSPEEDEHLSNLVEKFGENNWNDIAVQMPGRTIRQCRERWRQYLSPAITKVEWTRDQDFRLVETFIRLGPKWTQIAQDFPGSTPSSLKNRIKVLQRRSERMARNIKTKPEDRLDPELFRIVLQSNDMDTLRNIQIPEKNPSDIVSIEPN